MNQSSPFNLVYWIGWVFATVGGLHMVSQDKQEALFGYLDLTVTTLEKVGTVIAYLRSYEGVETMAIGVGLMMAGCVISIWRDRNDKPTE